MDKHDYKNTPIWKIDTDTDNTRSKKRISPKISDGKQMKDILYMVGVVNSMLNVNSKINPIKPLRKLKKR